MKRSYVILVLVLIALGLSAQIVPQVKNGDSKDFFWRLRSYIKSSRYWCDGLPTVESGATTFYYYCSDRPRDVDSMYVTTWNQYQGDYVEHASTMYVTIESLPESYDVVEHWYLNSGGVFSPQKVIRNRYNYDDLLLQHSQYGSDGLLAESVEYEYDENGNKLLELCFNRDYGQWHLDYSLETAYNEDNLPISTMRIHNGGNPPVIQSIKSEQFFYSSYSIPDSISAWEDNLYDNSYIATTQTNYFDNDSNCIQNHRTENIAYNNSGETHSETRDTFYGYISGPNGFLPLWDRSYGQNIYNNGNPYPDSTSGVYTYGNEYHTQVYTWTNFNYASRSKTRTYNEGWLLTGEWGNDNSPSEASSYVHSWDWEYVAEAGIVVPPAPDIAFVRIAPNPFSLTTGIIYTAAARSDVKIDVYNLRGQKVSSVANGVALQGVNQISWKAMDDTGKALPSGVYILRISTPRGSAVAKMVLAR